MYCLQTETGAFVVRRNGKAFISGNSGFPKSMNIGKSILNDIERQLREQGVDDIQWKE